MQKMFFDGSADNTVAALKTTPGQLHSLEVQNPNASDIYIQLFDAAVADVTLGTTTPNWSFIVPANGAMDKSFPQDGVSFAQAMTYAVTTTPTGSTAPASAAVVNAGYS